MNFEITLTPQRRDEALTLSKQGDVLIINGEGFDFSGVSDGAILPHTAVACNWLSSDITRNGDTLYLNVILPHGANFAHKASAFMPCIITSDGPISLPDPMAKENAA